MKKPIYSLKNLSLVKSEHKVLSINKFDFHRGAMYLFSGSIGSGKSSLMKVLTKDINVDKGLLFYEDQDITNISSSNYGKDTYFVDRTNKRPWLGGSVEKYMLKQIKSKVSDEYSKVFKKICNSMKISDYLLKSDINKISDGEFRWVLLSIAIAVDTKVLIIDYLEKYLDSNRRIILNRVLKRKSSHDGVTIIATSYVPEAFKMSTSVFIKMDRGRITQVRSVSHKSK
tara:strand:+ start:201 stop:884 length:684 start_codon:yes stop_codon:yes gene_type:complete